MKKNDGRIVKRTINRIPQHVGTQIDEFITEVPCEYPNIPQHSHGCHHNPCDDAPSHHEPHEHHHHHCEPEPIYPHPQHQCGHLAYTNGVQMNNGIVSVKVDKDSANYMITSEHGVSIKPLLRLIERLNKDICDMKTLIVDLNSEVNKLRGQTRPSIITQTIVNNSESFVIDDETGKIGLKTGESLIVDKETGIVDVDYDDETISLVDGKVSTIASEWEPGEWNTEEEDKQ